MRESFTVTRTFYLVKEKKKRREILLCIFILRSLNVNEENYVCAKRIRGKRKEEKKKMPCQHVVGSSSISHTQSTILSIVFRSSPFSEERKK